MTLIRKTVMPTQLSAVYSLSTIEYYYNMQTYAKNSEVNYIILIITPRRILYKFPFRLSSVKEIT